MAVRERGRLQLLNRVVQNGRRITQLRATETRLKRTDKSEQLLSNAIEQSSEGVAIIDLDGNLLSLNTAFAAMHGYSREEALGRHLSIFHTVEQLPSVALANEQLQATGEFAGEIWHARRDGTVFPSLMHNSILRDDAGNPVGMIGTLQDITERKQVEEERDRIFNLSQDLICIAGTDGFFKHLNPAWEQVLRYSTQELLARPFLDFIHPDDHHKNDAEVAKLAAGEKTIGFENRYICKDGSVRTVSWTAASLPELGQMYCIGRDITKWKQAQDQLESYRYHLEKMVKERTAELQEANQQLRLEVAERIRTEDRTRASEKWLSTTIRSIGDGFIATDAKGHITLMNPVAQALTGWSQEEASGKPLKTVFNVVNEETGKPAQDIAAQVIRAGMAFGLADNSLLIARDGTTRPIADSGAPIMDEDGNVTGVVLVFQDVTKQRMAEEELQHRTHDLGERVKELNCLYGISALVETPDVLLEVILQGAADLISASWQYPAITCARILFEDKEFKTDTWTETDWKQVSDISVHGKPVGAVQVCYLDEKPQLDEGPFLKEERHLINAIAERLGRIIERQQAEEVVQKAREYAENVVTTVREPLVILDDELRVVFANRSFYETFKVSPEETERQLLYDLGNRQWNIPKLRELLEEILPTNTKLEDYEVECNFEAIGRKTMLLNAGRIRTEEEKEEELILLAIKDITELKKLQEQMVRWEKLAILGQVAGGMGHELRNPLGAITNCSYFLKMVLENPEPDVTETLRILEKEVSTCEKLITSLLSFARPKPPILRKVDINEVVQEVLSNTILPDNVSSTIRLGEALPTILADPDQLVQIFGNLVTNAIQAMSQGGELTVKTEVISPEWVTISITDSGVGIARENLNMVFEPLFTTKAKGIGLGLAVVKALVEGHGGSIEVTSTEGVGTTFTVKMPLGKGGEE